MTVVAITYYPRLSDPYTISMIETMVQNTPQHLSEMATISHPMATYYPTAATHASREQLQALRDRLIGAAKRLGFPTYPSPDKAREFDQAASGILDEHLEIVPAEAANREMWNFLTVVLLPDLAKWRYRNSSNNLTYERWLGTDRNVFRKLWWREVTLGRTLNAQLGEDESVAIMERPLLGGNPTLARASAKALLQVSVEYPDIARSHLMRKGMVGVRRLAPIRNFEAFDDRELDRVVLEIFRSTSAAYQHHLAKTKTADD